MDAPVEDIQPNVETGDPEAAVEPADLLRRHCGPEGQVWLAAHPGWEAEDWFVADAADSLVDDDAVQVVRMEALWELHAASTAMLGAREYEVLFDREPDHDGVELPPTIGPFECAYRGVRIVRRTPESVHGQPRVDRLVAVAMRALRSLHDDDPLPGFVARMLWFAGITDHALMVFRALRDHLPLSHRDRLAALRCLNDGGAHLECIDWANDLILDVPWFAPAHLQKALALSALGRQRDAMVAFRSGLDLVERARRAGFEIELKGIEWTEPPLPSDDPIGDAHRHELVDAACEEFPAYCRAVAACFGDECALRLFRRAVPRLLDRWASTGSTACEIPFGDEAPSRDLHACQLAAGWIAGRNFDTANWLFDALPAPPGEDERLYWDMLRSIAREGGRESRAGER